MAKLTDAHLVILSAAAERDDCAVLPLPKSIRMTSSATALVLKGLIKRRLVAEQKTAQDDATWRKAKDGQRIGLVVTDAGLNAIGVDKVEKPATPTRKSAGSPTNKSATPSTGRNRKSESKSADTKQRPGTKQELLIGLLRRKDGATIPEIAKATGWQGHSVRGAISGSLKKKLGLAVVSATVEGRSRVYRITGAR